MTRRWLCLLVWLAWSLPVGAQAPMVRMDLAGLGWGVISQPVSVDTDGDPATEEWIIGGLFTSQKRIVAMRPQGLCVGPWFTVSPEWTLQVRGGRTVYTRLVWPVFDVMTLQTPVCGP
jgi:hypothetical protein